MIDYLFDKQMHYYNQKSWPMYHNNKRTLRLYDAELWNLTTRYLKEDKKISSFLNNLYIDQRYRHIEWNEDRKNEDKWMAYQRATNAIISYFHEKDIVDRYSKGINREFHELQSA